MSTKTEIHLKDFNDNQPDRLLETLKIELTDEQKIYVKKNKHDKRTLLHKKFNLHFGTRYTKIQLTQAIEVMNAPKFKPTGKRKPVKSAKNVYWIDKRKTWMVQFRIAGKSKSLGYYKVYDDAKNAADKFRQNLA